MVAVSGFQTIGVDNLTPHIGAEIDGVDLSKDCLLYTSPSPRDRG